MDRTIRHAAALISVFGLVLAAGCTPEAPARGVAESSTFNVSLAPVGESGIQGLTTVSRGEALTLKLELMGLESGKTYGAALVSGTCDAPGEELTEMSSATSGAIGIGSSVTPVEFSVVEGEGALHVEAYLPDGTLAACGDIPSERI